MAMIVIPRKADYWTAYIEQVNKIIEDSSMDDCMESCRLLACSIEDLAVRLAAVRNERSCTYIETALSKEAKRRPK